MNGFSHLPSPTRLILTSPHLTSPHLLSLDPTRPDPTLPSTSISTSRAPPFTPHVPDIICLICLIFLIIIINHILIKTPLYNTLIKTPLYKHPYSTANITNSPGSSHISLYA